MKLQQRQPVAAFAAQQGTMEPAKGQRLVVTALVSRLPRKQFRESIAAPGMTQYVELSLGQALPVSQQGVSQPFAGKFGKWKPVRPHFEQVVVSGVVLDHPEANQPPAFLPAPGCDRMEYLQKMLDPRTLHRDIDRVGPDGDEGDNGFRASFDEVAHQSRVVIADRDQEVGPVDRIFQALEIFRLDLPGNVQHEAMRLPDLPLDEFGEQVILCSLPH